MMNLCQLINAGQQGNTLAEIYEGEYSPETRISFSSRDDLKQYLTRKVTYLNMAVDRNFVNDGHSTLIIVISSTKTEGKDSPIDHPKVVEFLNELDDNAGFKITTPLTKHAFVLNFKIIDNALPNKEVPLLVIDAAETIVTCLNPFMNN